MFLKVFVSEVDRTSQTGEQVAGQTNRENGRPMNTEQQQPSRAVLVPFRGGAIQCIQADGQAWVVLNAVCKMLGVDQEAQRKRLVAAPWATTFVTEAVAADGKKRDVFCLRSDVLAMWLATLSVKRVRPELRETLSVWQCEAAGVLARHFAGRAAPAAPAVQQQLFAEQDVRELVRKELAAQQQPQLTRLNRHQVAAIVRAELAELIQQKAQALTLPKMEPAAEPRNTVLPALADPECSYPSYFVNGIKVAVHHLGKPATAQQILEFAHHKKSTIPGLFHFLDSLNFLCPNPRLSDRQKVGYICRTNNGMRVPAVVRTSSCTGLRLCRQFKGRNGVNWYAEEVA